MFISRPEMFIMGVGEMHLRILPTTVSYLRIVSLNQRHCVFTLCFPMFYSLRFMLMSLIHFQSLFIHGVRVLICCTYKYPIIPGLFIEKGYSPITFVERKCLLKPTLSLKLAEKGAM